MPKVGVAEARGTVTKIKRAKRDDKKSKRGDRVYAVALGSMLGKADVADADELRRKRTKLTRDHPLREAVRVPDAAQRARIDGARTSSRDTFCPSLAKTSFN